MKTERTKGETVYRSAFWEQRRRDGPDGCGSAGPEKTSPPPRASESEPPKGTPWHRWGGNPFPLSPQVIRKSSESVISWKHGEIIVSPLQPQWRLYKAPRASRRPVRRRRARGARPRGAEVGVGRVVAAPRRVPASEGADFESRACVRPLLLERHAERLVRLVSLSFVLIHLRKRLMRSLPPSLSSSKA